MTTTPIGVLMLAGLVADSMRRLVRRRPAAARHPGRTERRLTRLRLNGSIDAPAYRHAMEALAHTSRTPTHRGS